MSGKKYEVFLSHHSADEHRGADGAPGDAERALGKQEDLDGPRAGRPGSRRGVVDQQIPAAQLLLDQGVDQVIDWEEPADAAGLGDPLVRPRLPAHGPPLLLPQRQGPPGARHGPASREAGQEGQRGGGDS